MLSSCWKLKVNVMDRARRDNVNTWCKSSWLDCYVLFHGISFSCGYCELFSLQFLSCHIPFQPCMGGMRITLTALRTRRFLKSRNNWMLWKISFSRNYKVFHLERKNNVDKLPFFHLGVILDRQGLSIYPPFLSCPVWVSWAWDWMWLYHLYFFYLVISKLFHLAIAQLWICCTSRQLFRLGFLTVGRQVLVIQWRW